MSPILARLLAHPVARISVEIEGLKPLWLPTAPLLSHRPLTIDFLRHLALKRVLADACHGKTDLWYYVQIHPTVIKVAGRVDGEFVYNWRAAFGLMLPLGMFERSIETGRDLPLYAARCWAEVGRAKGLLRAGGDYGTYTISRWVVLEISKLDRRGIAWARKEKE